MSKPWSKLQKEFYLLRADGLDLQLHCRVYRMNSQRGTTNCPRYWVTLEKDIIWDYPKDFAGKTNSELYPYDTSISNISNLIREYIDTPKNEILTKEFENDQWGIVGILRSADKRIGTRRLPELWKTVGQSARKIICARLFGMGTNDTQIEPLSPWRPKNC